MTTKRRRRGIVGNNTIMIAVCVSLDGVRIRRVNTLLKFIHHLVGVQVSKNWTPIGWSPQVVFTNDSQIFDLPLSLLDGSFILNPLLRDNLATHSFPTRYMASNQWPDSFNSWWLVGYSLVSMNHFLIWLPIGWRLSRQPIRSHVSKLLLVNSDFKRIALVTTTTAVVTDTCFSKVWPQLASACV